MPSNGGSALDSAAQAEILEAASSPALREEFRALRSTAGRLPDLDALVRFLTSAAPPRAAAPSAGRVSPFAPLTRGPGGGFVSCRPPIHAVAAASGFTSTRS